MDSGVFIRDCRKQEGLKIRELAALINTDPTLLGKIERSERLATRQQVIQIVEILNLDDKLMVLWLSDKINSYVCEDKELGLKALKVSEDRLKYGNE